MELIPVENEKIIRGQLINILTELGFKDGASLLPQELEEEKSPIFWEDILDIDIAQTKPYYLVFSIGSQSSIYADDKPIQSTITISLDVFTTKDISSKDVYDLRSKLETKFSQSKNFFNIQLLSKFYDSELAINHIAYSINKVITINEYINQVK